MEKVVFLLLPFGCYYRKDYRPEKEARKEAYESEFISKIEYGSAQIS